MQQKYLQHILVKKDTAIYGGLFLISLAILLIEITLTKIFSVILWYHFSFFVVSLAMFGLGFGGLVVYLLTDQFQLQVRKKLHLLSLLLAISIIVNLFNVISYELPSLFNAQQLLYFLMLYTTCTAPFVLCGMIVSILFLNKPEHSYAIYGADLLGAAVGCIACIVLITYLSAPQVILIASLLCMLAAILFDFPKIHLYAWLLLIGLILFIPFANSVFKVTKAKIYSELIWKPIYEKWSPLSRITVLPKILARNTKVGEPFTWGISSTYKTQGYYKQLWIEQDAHAGSPIVPFDGDYNKVDYLKYDITAFPYYLRKNARVFILGVGGGRDVLTALLFNSKAITGVDIHPVIINLVKNIFADFAGHIYSHPKVTIAVAEGRSFLEKSNKQYDIIQIPLIDSWAATVSGAFAMSENSLYTKEAFAVYLNHLNPSGLLSITRFYFKPENETLKIAILARVALEALGIHEPDKHIVILKSKPIENAAIATTLIKRTPFLPNELAQITSLAQKLAFDIVYMPSHIGNETLFQNALTTNDLSAFLNSYYYDVRPTTDDRPFFFQMLYTNHMFDLFKTKLSGQVFNFYSLPIFYFLFIISAFLVLFFFIFPLIFSKKIGKLSLCWGLYFTLLGLGFMLIEIPVIQLGALYLEGTTYGLSVALFCLLFFGGIGCILANQLKPSQLRKMLQIVLLVIFSITLFLPVYFHQLMQVTFSLAWGVKLLLFTGILLPLATCMGLALPTGLKIIKQQTSDMVTAIPWYWALNGGASVLGSIIAMASSMQFGYSFTLYSAAFVYLAAFVIFLLLPALRHTKA
ncbi:Spermidine synthase [Legionella beliardensis]|uniref:Spermidine synthase n=1 Tax=Legionella beliardensis TaxID=91822 RepID=A0A378HYZ7_9GAMM|nr:hypothetical protein [Legionella beliardensis]STX27690.1 Spermidine synthase [Legionella beliardensis]